MKHKHANPTTQFLVDRKRRSSKRKQSAVFLLITTLTRTNAAATLSDLEYGAYPGWKSQSDSQSLCPSPVIMISPLKKEINPIRHAQVLYVQNN